MTITNTSFTAFCQQYLASNPAVTHQLAQITQVLKTEFNLVAGGQFETFDYLGNPKAFRWQLRVIGTNEKVGELVHYIFNSLSEFYFKSYLDNDGMELISHNDRIHTKLSSLSQAWKKKEDIMARLKD